MMTEAEFMSRASIGNNTHGRLAEDPDLIFPALIEFLHSNGFHDVARVMRGVHDSYADAQEAVRFRALIGA